MSTSALDKWVRQLKEKLCSITLQAAPLTPEQIEIRELKKRVTELEEHNKTIKRL